LTAIGEALLQAIGVAVTPRLTIAAPAHTPVTALRSEAQLLQDPYIRQVMQLFGGKIVEVRRREPPAGDSDTP
jgi:hypothetical protein